MSKINDGGPAFPRTAHLKEGDPDNYWSACAQDGMTLRDWFAGQALSVLMLSGDPSREGHARLVASRAYAVADAMIAARGEP